MAVNAVTGSKLYTVSSNGVNSYCPATTDGNSILLLGKTSELQYHNLCVCVCVCVCERERERDTICSAVNCFPSLSLISLYGNSS